MIKKIIITIVSVVLFGTIITLSVITNIQTKHIKFQEKQIAELNVNLKKAIEKTAISFSINPEITHKITSAFGSTKYLTVQYYFTLDGNAMITQPDSVYSIVKEYKK